MEQNSKNEMNYSYKVRFIALDTEKLFNVSTPDKAAFEEFVNDLNSIFVTTSKDGEYIVKALQEYSAKNKKGINDFINKYKTEIPQLNAISAYFRKLKPNEKFFYIPNMDLGNTDVFKIHDTLRALSIGVEYEDLPNKITDILGEVLPKYHISTIGSQRVSIGGKGERLCRFCNNQRKPTTFKNKAHAISEALGNKTVILLDECDECNKEFSETIEPDIIQYLSLFRTFFDVKGKGGSKKYKGKNFDISSGEQVHIKLRGKADNTTRDEKGFKTKLEADQPIVFQNIYKSLCKYFLSVIDEKYLHHFEKTIDWINGEAQLDELPKIADVISYKAFSTQPKLSFFLRKDDDMSIPYAVGAFYFTAMVLVFIIPSSDRDDRCFTEQKDFDNFWKTFGFFDNIKGWTFTDYSNNTPKEFNINLNFTNKDD